MAYEPSKDKELARFDLNTIVVTVNQYNGGVTKVGISRKYEDKKTGEEGLMKSGRLTMDEFSDLVAIGDDIAAAGGKGKKKTKTKKKKGKKADDDE